ncbi:MaoC/PaaZ C-terminal domain-containing protein [Segnochrobactraceae bacterium EtOH-i3]
MSRAYSLPEAIAFDRTLTQGDFDLFAQVSGDTNPLHINAEFALTSRFGRTLAPGMLLYAVVWGAVHQVVPEAVTRRVTLTWSAPVFADEVLSVAITPQDTNGGIRFRLTRSDGVVCCEGQTRLGQQDDALIVSDDMAVMTPATDTAPQPKVGARARVDRKFSASDLAGFAVLAGLDAARFSSLPEPLIGALFSQLVGTRLPGKGTLYKKQQLEFVLSSPLYQPLTAAVELAAVDDAHHQATLRTLVTLADGTTIADGRALVSTGGGRAG